MVCPGDESRSGVACNRGAAPQARRGRSLASRKAGSRADAPFDQDIACPHRFLSLPSHLESGLKPDAEQYNERYDWSIELTSASRPHRKIRQTARNERIKEEDRP